MPIEIQELKGVTALLLSATASRKKPFHKAKGTNIKWMEVYEIKISRQFQKQSIQMYYTESIPQKENYSS